MERLYTLKEAKKLKEVVEGVKKLVSG